MQEPVLTNHTVIRASDAHASVDLHGEAVVLDVEEGVYYGLNPVGAYIWELIQTPQSIGELVDALLNRYEVEESQCRRDVDAILRKLLDEGMVTVEA